MQPMADVEVEQKVNKLFAPLWNERARYYILMGGRGRGASTANSQFLISKLLAPEFFRSAIMREVHSDIRHSIWRELNDRIEEQGIKEALSIADNEMRVLYGRNSIQAHGFRASSASHTAKLKSLANYNVVSIDEADETSEASFMVLDDSLRTVKGEIVIILVLNAPPKSHWIIQRFFDLEDSGIPGYFIPRLKSGMNAVHIGGTHKDNIKNLDAETVRRYQGYKSNKPDYYYQVIEGLVPETIRGKIYSGWQLIEGVPDGARLLKNGEDFGWFPDPACAAAIYYWNGGYVLDELAYGTELTNEFLATAIKENMEKVGVKVQTVADSAEPKSIAEQNKYGISVVGCAKGKDSVAYRIKVVSTKKIWVTKRSVNIWKSYENYAWDEDKDGNPKGVPQHMWSHAMDAIGYPIAEMHNKSVDLQPRNNVHRMKKNIAV